MRSLPDWFGIEESIRQYRRDLETMETIVADAEGQVIGFLTLRRHNPHSAEIQVLAVRRGHHRRGVGRALVERGEEIAAGSGSEFLQVKTLGPSRPDAAYERTREFYVAVGFRPLEENHLWGERIPCLILVKHLRCSGRGEKGGTW